MAYLETQINPVMQIIVSYTLGKRSGNPAKHMLDKVRELIKQREQEDLEKRKPQLEAKFALKNPGSKFIDTDDDYVRYLKLVQRRYELREKLVAYQKEQKAIEEKQKHLALEETKRT